MRISSGWQGRDAVHRRLAVFVAAAAIVFLLLLMRLWYLQVISFERFQQRSLQNRLRVLTLAAPRGPIYDRRGELLVDNRPAFNISVMRQEMEDSDALFARLSELLAVDRAELEANWREGRRLPNYRPIPLARDVGRDALERVLEHSVELPGILPEVQPVRSYLNKDMAAHLLGYLGEITKDDFDRSEYRDYQIGDFIGKNGIEAELEHVLRGQEGERLIEVDVRGKLLRELQTRDPRPGNKVYLTIDRTIQQATEDAFADQAGAAVMLDVRNGALLALTSRPGFDPSLFARGIRTQEWADLVNNPLLPLQNRAIAGQYPPGSTFKVVMALSALQNNVAHAQTSVDCTGEFYLGEALFRCWKKIGHGVTDLHKAMRESCDIWFYQAGLELGIDRISETAFSLGLGHRTQLALTGEKSGLIPTRDWKRQRYGKGWFGGETVITSIGQGAVLVTPIQMAVMMAAVANGGTVYRPQLIQRIENLDGQVLQQFDPVVLKQNRFRPEVLQLVHSSLEAVIQEEHGTGRGARLPGIRIAGKTGTSQVVKRLDDDELKNAKETPYRFRDHALFIAYAPAEKPEVAVAVVVEHGEHGGSAAAPIAAAMLRSYFGQPAPEKKDDPS